MITYVYTGQKGAIVSPPQLTPGQLVASPAPQQPAEQAGAIRMTYRTLRVLNALAENPGACNRQIAEAAGISDQGQISRLLRRLSDQALVRNEGETRNGAPKRWRLTDRGETLRRRGQEDLRRHGSNLR